MTDITKIYSETDYIINDAPEIYGKNTDNLEKQRISNYAAEKEYSFVERVRNLQELLELNQNIDKINSDLLTESIKTADVNTIDNVKTLNVLNNEIMTKSRIIMMNENTYNNKEFIVSIMQSIILYLFLMILPVLLISLGNISFLTGIIFILVCGLITAIVIIIRYIKANRNDASKFITEVKDDILHDAKNAMKVILPPTTKKCDKNNNMNNLQNNQNNKKNKKNKKNMNNGNEVYIDNSNNIWKDGDVPEIGAELDGYLALTSLSGEEALPLPYYTGLKDPNKYTCTWTGDSKKITTMNKGIKFNTSIPCEFYPGYITEES